MADLSEYGTVTPAAPAASAPDLSQYGTIVNPGTPLFTKSGQKNVTPGPSGLPSDLPKRMLDAGMTALPYVGAGVASALLPESAPAWASILAAGAGGAAGSAVEQGGRAATGIDAPSSFGDAASKVGGQALEQSGNELGGKAVGWIAGKTIGKYLDPKALYQSALKPPGSDAVLADNVADTGIREGIKLDKQASPIVRSRIDALANQVDNIIKSNPQNISPADYTANIQKRFDALRDRWGKAGSKGDEYLRQIDQAERSFLLNNGNPQPITQQVPTQVSTGIVGPNGQPTMKTVMRPVTINPEDMDLATLRQNVQPIPVQRGQAIKQATYEALRTNAPGAYQEGSHPGLSTHLDQELAGSMRQELENMYPDIAAPNQRQGDLRDLDKAIGSFVARTAKQQITPYFVFPAVGAMAGSTFGGVEGAGFGGAAGMLGAHLTRQMLEDPAVKSALAIMLDKGGKTMAGKAAGIIADNPANVMRAGEYALGQYSKPDTAASRMGRQIRQSDSGPQ